MGVDDFEDIEFPEKEDTPPPSHAMEATPGNRRQRHTAATAHAHTLTDGWAD